MTYETFLNELSIPDIKQNPLRYVLENCSFIEGDFMEFGVYYGRTINQIAECFSDRTVYGFDSFEGLPEDWARPDCYFAKGSFFTHGGMPKVRDNVVLVKGLFKDSLPEMLKTYSHDKKIALLHIDCDLYSSTKTVFEYLTPYLADGTIIVFDELTDYPTCIDHELKAFFEFLQEGPFKVEWIGKNGPISFVGNGNDAYEKAACVLRNK